jgi:hypothetical protein
MAGSKSRPVVARGGAAAGADDPDAHVRQPRVDYGSHAIALDRNELGTLLVAAGLGSPIEQALISCER